MAAPSINQRIQLVGADEVRRHLESIAAAGQKAGNQTRTALLAASSGANSFTAGARSAGASSGQMRFALQNLSFQVNDVATSLASGGDAMRVFAQQGGQVFQAFQQGGGLGPVLRAAGAGIASLITPMTLAATAALALGAGLALVIARAVESQSAARRFDVILKGLGDRSGVTGTQLVDAARRLRDVGLSFDDATKAMESARRQGIKATELERIVRIGQNLNTVLGEGSLEQFITAAAEGGEPLRKFAERLGLVPKAATDATAALNRAGGAVSASTKSIQDALISRNRAIADQQRSAASQIAELTRQRGTAEEEIEYASKQRILEINRESILAVNALLAKRNEDNAKSLAEYNKQIEEAAQKALDAGQGLINQIEGRVAGANEAALGPFARALRDLNTAWNDMLNEFAKSDAIQFVIRDFTELFRVVSDLLRAIRELRNGLDLTSSVATAAFAGGGNFASGGLVRGPGTGTSDSIVARLSDGEYVVRAAAARMNLPLLQAINAMRMPSMPQMRMPRGFASGGLVTAGGGGGSPIYLTFPSGATVGPMMADRQVRKAMEREGRRAAMLSAGKLPSTA